MQDISLILYNFLKIWYNHHRKKIRNYQKWKYSKKCKQNNVAHVGPCGRDAKDFFELPIVDKLTGNKAYTRHCFV